MFSNRDTFFFVNLRGCDRSNLERHDNEPGKREMLTFEQNNIILRYNG